MASSINNNANHLSPSHRKLYHTEPSRGKPSGFGFRGSTTLRSIASQISYLLAHRISHCCTYCAYLNGYRVRLSLLRKSIAEFAEIPRQILRGLEMYDVVDFIRRMLVMKAICQSTFSSAECVQCPAVSPNSRPGVTTSILN
jgi:hypothetical protein